MVESVFSKTKIDSLKVLITVPNCATARLQLGFFIFLYFLA